MIEQDPKPYGVIYYVLNTRNGKCYVGQTKRALEIRWKQHVRDSKNPKRKLHFHKAINHYGSHFFEVRTLIAVYSKEDLNAAEIYYIDFFNSTNQDFGYNSTFGGAPESPNQETRKKMVLVWEKRRGEKIPDIEILVKDYVEGMSSVKISKKYGISKRRVLDGFKSVGFKTRSNSDSKRIQKIYSLKEEYLQGSNCETLSKKYGVSVSWVWGQLKSEGILLRTSMSSRIIDLQKEGKLSKLPTDVELKEEYLSGFSSVYLSKKYNTTATRIINRLKLAKTVMRGRGRSRIINAQSASHSGCQPR